MSAYRTYFCVCIVSVLVLLSLRKDLRGQSGNGPVLPSSEIRIDVASVKHRMAGGAGAEWDAIGPTAFSYKDLLVRENRDSRGSTWGGNPPLEYTQAWNDLQDHARWLGLNFIRVGIDMRMYEPERGKFDWQNDEMKTLYRIPDFCQENYADVFLTQMWGDVDWNAFPGTSRLTSAPKSAGDFAQGLATLMEYLIKTRNYTCIRWLCIANEPGMSWGWWLGADGKPASLMPALHAVRAELDKRGISVGLAGPDWSPMDQSQNSPDFDFNDRAVAAFDAHNYGYFPNTRLQKLWADMAHARGIPFFQSEFGDWAGGDPFSDHRTSSPISYANQLFNAEKLIEGMNVGVDGFNRWSFTNRGDLDGQHQLVRTFDTNSWQYFHRVVPVPVPYFSYGILTRFMAKHSAVLQTESSNSDLAVAALRSPRGNFTVYILNKSDANAGVRLVFTHLQLPRTLYKYQVTESGVNDPHYEMNPGGPFKVTAIEPAIEDHLARQSITVYSTYKMMSADPGIMSD
jgi:hypothetical protein